MSGARCWMCGRPRGPAADGLGSHCRRKLTTGYARGPRTTRRSAPADQPTLEDHMPLTAQQWNDRHPVGTPVIAYPGTRTKDDPDATRLVTRTRSEAQVLGDHTDVVWVDGHPACIALSHVDPIDPEQVARAMAEVNRTLTDFRAALGPAVQRTVANLVRVAEAVQAATAAQPGDFALAPPAEVERARDEQFAAWLLKKARESANSQESTADYLARLADKVTRGAIR